MSSIARLFALEQFGMRLGLEAMRALLAELHNPEQRWLSVHVAGTNGKGSVTAMVDEGLRAAGLSVGRYTSPHLARVEERVTIGGEAIGTAALESALDAVFGAVDRLVERGTLPSVPTYFEVATAAAFESFTRANVDAAVVEVGLGGRFDATNVVVPVVSAITTIDLDHEMHLGTTVDAIAREKAGIAKFGVPLLVGDVGDDAWRVIDSVAGDVGAPVTRIGATTEIAITMNDGHAVARITTPTCAYPAIRLGLAGRHQAANALVAVRILEEFARDTGWPLPIDAVIAGLRDVQWPARLEWLRHPATGARVLLDAAHNPAGARALAAYLVACRTPPLTLVTSVMADKDLAGVLGPMLPHAARVIATRADSARATSSAALASAVEHLAPAGLAVLEASGPEAAVTQALTFGAPVLIAGSIYLVGPLRASLLARGFRPA